MANGAKIRTMQDDIDEAKKNLEEQARQQQKPRALDVVEENIKKQPLQPKTIQPDQFSSRQAADLDAQQPEKSSAVLPEDRRPIFISPKKPIMQPSKKIETAEDNDLKNLIKRISNETDKDPYDNKDLTKKEVDKKSGPQTEKNNPIASKTVTKDKSIEEMEALKKDLDKIELEEKTSASSSIKKEDSGKNAKEIEDLKRIISRISKSSSEEKSAETKIDDIKKSEEKIQENNAPEPRTQSYKQNIQQSPQPLEVQKIEDEPVSALPDKNEDKSFWKNVLEQTKKTNKLRKTNGFNHENLASKSKTEEDGKFEKYSERSGILQRNDRQKEEPDKKSLSEKTYNENYTPPSERLAWEKQEFYSSVTKKINPREEKGEIESLKNADMIKNRQILSKDEEYKKLKYSIAKKYHINLFSLPWKKIISVAVIMLALTAIATYFVFSETSPFVPKITPNIVIGNEIEEFSSLEKEIIISKKNLKGFNNLESEALNIFNSGNNIKIIKLLAVDNEEEKKILSLSEALDSIGVVNIKENINHLPNGFLQAVTNNYNLFIFETDKGTIRYGLAIKANDRDSLFGIMRAWEKEEAKNKKMSSIFKPLFINDKNFEEDLSPFSTSFYKNIEIRYVHLVNKDTALNYFFYEDILVFTTSKETAFTMVDFLVPNN